MAINQAIKKKKIYCFDFDGTVADTLPLAVETLNKILAKEGGNEFSAEMFRRAREEGIESIYRDFNVSLLKLFFVVRKSKNEMNKEMKRISVKKEMNEALQLLKNQGNTMGILSSNSRKNVVDFLENNKMNYFDFVLSTGLFSKDKAIKKVKKGSDIFIYIGDETRDIKAGKAARVHTVAVTWGLSSREALLRSRPDVLIEEPRDLINLPF